MAGLDARHRLRTCGHTQENRAQRRGGSSGNVAAPIVPGTGRVTGGLGDADVERQSVSTRR
jgi:hypothetical protein